MLLYVLLTALVIVLADSIKIFRALALYFRIQGHVKPLILMTLAVYLSLGRSFALEVSII